MKKKVTGISFKRKIDRYIEKNSFMQNQIILQWVFFFLDLPDQMSLKQTIMIVIKSCVILVHTCMLQCKRNLNILIFSIVTCCISLPIFINSGGRPTRIKHKISKIKINKTVTYSQTSRPISIFQTYHFSSCNIASAGYNQKMTWNVKDRE